MDDDKSNTKLYKKIHFAKWSLQNEQKYTRFYISDLI